MINIVNDDIFDAQVHMEAFKNRDEKEVYCIDVESTSFDYVMNPEKDADELEKAIERKVQFREVIESLDTSIGALVKVKCMEEQDKKF